jgi:SdrD B-like domain
MESNMSGNQTELRDRTQQLLDGPLKHIRGAALAAALLPLASVAATPASAQAKCASGGVCGTVFNDTNKDGVQDVGEAGIENVTVMACQLCDGSDTKSFLTGLNGFYAIEFPDGTTKVFILIPSGMQASPPNVGDDAFDSDGVPDNGLSVASGRAADGTATDFGFFTQTAPPPPPLACTIPAASEVISPTSWNKFNVPFGAAPTVWVHAQFEPTGVPTTTSSTVQFTGVSFVLNGISYPMPDGTVNFDPNAPATSTTTFSGSPGRWTTTINPNFISDENFFVGAAIPVDAAIAGGGKATIRFTTQTDDTGLSFSWQWSAAVYTYWPSDWNQAKIQPYHGNGLHADTPTNTQVQKSLIQGPRGGGGSNFTGSWSATGHGACK